MGSIKGFIDWVKGEDVEDEYEEEMPRQRSEEPAMSSAPSYERSYDRSYDRAYDSAAAEPSSSGVVIKWLISIRQHSLLLCWSNRTGLRTLLR